MKRKHLWLRRALSIVLSFAVVLSVSLTLVGDGGTAHALTSLPYIEEIKYSGNSFNILEVVPAAGQGSIGYYIDGQEPCANWASAAAKSANAASPAARTTYVNNLFSSLSTAGILGTGDTTPLEVGSTYSEVFPWISHDNYKKMTLDHTETTTAKGTFSLASGGEYIQSSDFTFIQDGTGAYVQVIKYFSATETDQSGAKYYYAPEFAEIPDTSAVDDNTAVYTRESGKYVYLGTVGASDFPGMEIGSTYYYVTSYSAPSATMGGTYKYVAVSSAYRLKTGTEAGYFNSVNLKYTYVGSGSGTYNFAYNPSGASNTIDYNTVYYTGGFTNNNWFLKYVFDWTPSAGEAKPNINFKVTSVVGSSATISQVSNAHLIVLSAGFVPGGTATAYGLGNDISSALSTEIASESATTSTQKGKPIIVDYRLKSATGAQYISALATSLTVGNTNTNFAKDNIYCLNSNLATQGFMNAISGDHTLVTDPFYFVYKNIADENFLRSINGGTALSTTITMARAIRYIVNYTGKRETESKTKINVLEVQPGSGTQLTEGLVKNWLGYESSSTEIDVNIETMSTAELIGKIDVINEKYDIVYIGSNIAGFNPTNADTTDYNDNNMDGLIYSNIGDTVVMNNSDWTMSGLINRDYYTTTFTSGGVTYRKLNRVDLSRTFRYSGNDITDSKRQELQDFLNSGYPIIYASDLTSGARHPATDAVTFTVDVTGVQNGAVETLTASATTTGTLPSSTPSYQWYNASGAISGATSQSYDATVSGSYYCRITYYTYSGDPYSARSNAFTCTITPAYSSITNNNTGTAVTGSFFGATNFTVSETCNRTSTGASQNTPSSITFTSNISVGSPVPPTGYKRVYTWYKDSYDSEGLISSTALSTKTTTSTSNQTVIVYNSTNPINPGAAGEYDMYYCVAQLLNSAGTVISSEAQSVSFKVSYYNPSKVTIISVATNITGRYTAVTFTGAVTPTTGSSSSPITLSATPSISTYTTSYQWYDGTSIVSGETNSTLSVDSSAWANNETHSYSCQITKSDYTAGYNFTEGTAITNTVTLTHKADVIVLTEGTGKTSANFPAQTATSFTVDTSKVDSSSYIYKLMNDNVSKANVMLSSELTTEENQDKLNQYVNLSKPEIVWSTAAPNNEPYPTAYSNIDGTITSLTAKNGAYYLEYYFSVSNNTDPDPANTRYICNLYIDVNGDGRYGDAERLSDMVIREWNSDTGTSGAIVNSNSLKVGTEYYVSRRMPAEEYGIVPWKLEIKKYGTGSTGTLTSVNKYTHIPTQDGEQVKLSILQINASGGLSLADQLAVVGWSSYYSSVTQKYYAGIYGKLLADVSEDYDISITTVQISAIEPTAGKTWTHGTTTYTTLLDYLNSYDMLITGFKDVYGDLSQNAAIAIREYINTGKAILFTHDNTSFYNIPFSGYQTNDYYTVNSGFGYYFNMTIRDAVGLDRYGVTNPKYGISMYAPPEIRRASDWVGWTANGYSGANLTELTNAGYSIAYTPKSAKGSTVAETQGFTGGLLDRYKGSYDNFQTTTAVSQVNEGQITTYPYNVNTAGFVNKDSSTNSMNVALTHFQYYQLNMNSPDTVVWYCLKYSSQYSLYNDVSNTYYIYSKGNVTYSGAGHTTDTGSVNANVDEAKLFVNTMIAAYRVALVPPEVTFSDPTGKNTLGTCLLPADDAGVLSPTTSSDSSRNIYFIINDTNVGASKTITASFSYGTDKTALTATVPVYDSQTDTAITQSLVSGLSYYVKVDDIWGALPQAVKDSIVAGTPQQLNLTVTTTVNGETLSSGTSLTLRKLVLFNLS